MKTPFALIVLVAMFAAGCMSPGQRTALDSWKGHTVRELVHEIGFPVRVSPDGHGGRILAYYSNPGDISANFRGFGNGLRHSPGEVSTPLHSHKTLFYVDGSDIIYSWRME